MAEKKLVLCTIMVLTDSELSFEQNLIPDFEEQIILQSKFENCQACKYGKLIPRPMDKNSDCLVIYTRTGTYKGLHLEKRCNNQSLPCRAGHYYGFMKTSRDEKVIDDDALKNEFLITSRHTAFSVDYLWDITLQIMFSQASFESLGNIFNNLFFTNCPMDMMNERDEIVRKRISEAWFMYGCIEFGQRQDIEMVINKNIVFYFGEY